MRSIRATVVSAALVMNGVPTALLAQPSAQPSPPAEASPQFLSQLPQVLRDCKLASVAQNVQANRQSIYVPVEDGTKLAVDIFLPQGLKPGAKVPTMFTSTRYWRGRKGADISAGDRLWIARGYAVVNADVRGTGASFGNWYIPYDRQEAKDIGFLANWIARQPWSNGNVATTGNSYPGTTSLMSPAYGAPAIKVAVPRFSDYDQFTDLEWAGGISVDSLVVKWGSMVHLQDLNAVPNSQGVRPVDGPDGESLLAAAVAEHKTNPWSFDQAAYQVTFKDMPLNQFGGLPIDDGTVAKLGDLESASGVPILGWGSWMDSGIAQGMVSRFMSWKNPQISIIGAWTHGASKDANPYNPVDYRLDPPMNVQQELNACFIDKFVRGKPAKSNEHTLIYYTMGEDQWKTTHVWPILGTQQQRLYFGQDKSLTSSPSSASGRDHYKVDFDASAGPANRWATQAGGPDIDYGNRAVADAKLLTYTSSPVGQDTEVTGSAVVTLRITSDHTDGNFFAYLEDVWPDGHVTYVTEGQLHALNRKVSDKAPPYQTTYPYHSFSMADAELLTPGKVEELKFQLMPTSVLFKRDHRIRIAIAEADKGTFLQTPPVNQGDVNLEMLWGGNGGSFVDLPVIPRPNTSK